MSEVLDDLKFTKSHEWARVEDNVAVIGVSDHAQSQLGDLVFVELPELDSEYHAGVEMCVLESVKAAADVYAPVSGKVVEVNEDLNESPELVNSSPYDQGWLCKIEMKDESELDNLLSLEDYEASIEE